MKAMEASQEAEIVAFLSAAGTYLLPGGHVDVVETHCARVFLAGNEAFKVKKRVKFPFLDFTTIDKRFAACQREIDLNRPHAPTIYLGLQRISRSPDGRLNLNGIGETIDWAVHMRRFDQASVLASLAETGALPKTLPQKLATVVADYHRACLLSIGADGAERIRRLVTDLSAELSSSESPLRQEAVAAFSTLASRHLSEHARLLDKRAASGAVRRCHGDLHLGNIVLIDDEPIPFDALEFDEELATIDVLYDLAFLLMDLDHRGLRSEANIVLNGYVAERPLGSEIEGLACLPLFLACRAGVRAMVSLERARQKQASGSDDAFKPAEMFLASALRYLRPTPAITIAIGGLSGSGKSTLGRALAPLVGLAPGAIHLRSDIERKRLAGFTEQQRLPPEHYTIKTSKAVYDHLTDRAASIITSGHSAVTDAVFARLDERLAIEEAASSAGGHFVGFWLDAPAEQLISRVEARKDDASDATASVVRLQLDYDLGPIAWHRLNAATGPQGVLEGALAVLRAKGYLRD